MSAGVKDVREVVERARDRLGEHGQGTILFLDEVHRFNKTQQDALLPHVEEGLHRAHRRDDREPVLLADRTAAARAPRCSGSIPSSPTTSARCSSARSTDSERGLGAADLSDRRPTRSTISIDRSEGDARHALTSLEVAGALAAEDGRNEVTLADAEAALALRAVCATATTSTTTSSPRSSRASAAPTPTPGCTGSPACSKRVRTRVSSPAGW